MPKKQPKTPKPDLKGMTPADYYDAIREEWMETGDDSKLQEFCHSDYYRDMSYIQKNRGFLTGSKIKIFNTDQHWYKLMYVDEIPPPHTPPDDNNEALLIGSCFDDLITYGQTEVEERYIVMDRRVSNVEDELAKQAQIMAEAKEDLKKDGERTATGIKREQAAAEKIAFLNHVAGKKQMTQVQMDMVMQMYGEWIEQPLFKTKPDKKYIFFKLLGEIPMKCELDDFEEHFTDETVDAYDFLCVRDAKTCANIENAIEFADKNYIEQMTLYALGAQYAYKDEETDRKVCAIIEAVDKHGFWSRSAGLYFSPQRLDDVKPVIIQKAEACWMAHKTGMFLKSHDFLPDCPYYGWKEEGDEHGYGRARTLISV